MYREITGIWAYQAGGSGGATVQVPPGAIVLQIVAWASSGSPTITINGGSAFAIPATSEPVALRFQHDLVMANGSGSGAAIVFSSAVAGYFVEYMEQQGYGT